jgi:hypothetical protein
MIRRLRLRLIACAAVCLGGCAAPSPGGAPTGATIPSAAVPLTRSWMDGGVSKQDLLYVSDGNGEVTVYRYWQHTLVGALTSMTQPMGECAGAAGDVYITDYAEKKIFEFAHGGTKPAKKLDDSPDSPYACSVDPTTGNLAVANNDAASQGNLSIWTNGSGTRKIYTDAALPTVLDCAYDGNGNLLISDGGDYTNSAQFAWLPKGGKNLINVKVPGPNPSWRWTHIEGIEWDGRYFGIGAYDIYRVSLIHGQAYFVGKTTFADSGVGGSFWFYDNKPGSQATGLVAVDYSESSSEVYYWTYPAGGSPVYLLTHGVDKPTGVTVSLRTN